ncbi:MAG: ParB/RepB/Spo0J family partition protein, partial [Candidatus Bathyarchaeia archaeon]
LMKNIETMGILQPIVVRPVGDMYDVIVGRRRFLSAKQSGAREIDCVVKEMNDEEVLDASLSENIIRSDVDPVTLGKWLKRRIEMSGKSLTWYADKIGKSPSVPSEWIRMNDLSEGMQRLVSEGAIAFRDALKVARLDLPYWEQEALAKKAVEEGAEEFRKELERLRRGQEKRGAPKGLLIIRVNFGKESEVYDTLDRLAEEKGMELSDYVRSILEEHARQGRTDF